jgi:hypothetical protein
MIRTITWEEVVQHGFKGISGTHYKLESEISVDRYAKLQEYLVEVATNMSASDLMRLIAGAYNDLQSPKLMDAGEKLRKIIEFGKRVDTYPHPAMKACAMFINKDTDTTETKMSFNEVEMMDKCADWRDIGIGCFFELLGSFKGLSSKNYSANLIGSQRKEMQGQE